MSKTISFAEIVQGRDASVRVTDDGMILAVDLVMVMTGKNRDDSGKVLRNISDEVFHSAKFTEWQFSTRGGPKTKLVSFKDALELVMVLPGKVAKETRTQFAGIIQRYMAGDVCPQEELPVARATISKTISFAEIVSGREASVRVTDDGLLYAVDLVMAVTGKERDYSGQILRALSEEIFQSRKFLERQLSNRGGHKTKLLSMDDSIQLVMVLPGETAKETRAQFAGIIRRYMAGDVSLAMEVEANAQSAAPIAQMARASLAAESSVVVEPVPDEQSLIRKRKLESLEIEKLELDITIRRREAELDLRRSEFEYATKITNTYRDLCQDTVMDTRARLMFKDYYLNMIMGPPQQQPVQANMIANGGTSQAAPPPVSQPPAPSKPISLSQVATSMGLKIPTNELISLGGRLRKRYEEKHGHPPGKHDQLCDGRMTKVNSYMESDRPLVEGLLREWQGAARV